ncbi:MAG TPA: hypothetical protein VGM91_08715 [Conexibacter sp.]|jgi:hypothetical protein
MNKRLGLFAVRYGMPLVLLIVGGYLLQTRTDRWAGLGIMLIGTAIIVLMINVLFRLSVRSNDERDREEEARVYFDEHGDWPAWYR